MSLIPKGCIFGCDPLVTYNIPMHRFPHPGKHPDLLSSWISVVRDYLTETDPMKIYKNKRICDCHFDSIDKISGRHLKQTAVPSVNLNCIQQSSSTFVDADHCYYIRQRESVKSEATPMMDITHLPGLSRLAADSANLPNGSTDMICIMSEKSSVKTEQIKFDADDTAAEQDDTDLYHSSLGIHTECDIPLDIVKEEPDDVDTGVPGGVEHCLEVSISGYCQENKHSVVKIEVIDNKNNVATGPMGIDKLLEDDTGGSLPYKNISDVKTAVFDNNGGTSVNKLGVDQNGGSYLKIRSYTCDVCQKCFSNKGNLVKHIRKHAGEKQHQCIVCGKCFNSKNILNIHSRTHTGESHQCPSCKKCFRQKNYLNSHMLTHIGEKSYQCNVCKKCFKHKGHFHRHIVIRSCMKNYCMICKKGFCRKSTLDNHNRSHKEKPHQCKICDASFCEKYDLKIHNRTHMVKTSFECKICRKSFDHKGKFNIHIRTHTGEKPYQCNVCLKGFRRNGHLKSHFSRIHRSR